MCPAIFRVNVIANKVHKAHMTIAQARTRVRVRVRDSASRTSKGFNQCANKKANTDWTDKIIEQGT